VDLIAEPPNGFKVMNFGSYLAKISLVGVLAVPFILP